MWRKHTIAGLCWRIILIFRLEGSLKQRGRSTLFINSLGMKVTTPRRSAGEMSEGFVARQSPDRWQMNGPKITRCERGRQSTLKQNESLGCLVRHFGAPTILRVSHYLRPCTQKQKILASAHPSASTRSDEGLESKRGTDITVLTYKV
jgi:hypothetical protein